MPTKADADSAQLQRKATVIEEIRRRLDASDAAVLTEYRGLTVQQLSDLRKQLKSASAEYRVVKNRLARVAIEGYDFTGAGSQPEGRLTISGGVAAFPADAPDDAGLIKAADDSLYRAKSRGRNRVEPAGKSSP